MSLVNIKPKRSSCARLIEEHEVYDKTRQGFSGMNLTGIKIKRASSCQLKLILLTMLGLTGCSDPQYDDHAETKKFISSFAETQNWDKAELTALFSQVERKESILEAIARPAEKSKPWHDYREIFVNDRRISRGEAFIQQHKEALIEAERQFGVPSYIIASIIGVEVDYGRNTGSFRVIDALSTLGFDYPPRSDFFRKELGEFLLLTREEQLDPLALKGSYAGAMGLGQFMPSSYRNYAIDFDGDGKKDIWTNPVDAIGSVANYLKEHGWQPDAPVVAKVQWPKNSGVDTKPLLSNGLELDKKVQELTDIGAKVALDLSSQELVTFFRLEGEEGDEYWLGLENFYVITRYNRSRMYAMAVYQLGEELQRFF